jgi:soluble lytic murein transglycosylase-like protein
MPGGARADYIVLRNGQRLMVTSYQLRGDTYILQLQGGTAEVPASEVAGIEPQDIFTPSAPPPAKLPFTEAINTAARRYRVDADLIHSVIAVESRFDPKAVSRKHARGLMQLLPETAAQLGVRDVFDPAENINGGTQYLSLLLARYGNNLPLALAAYNAGPRLVERYGTVPPFSETMAYIERVQREYARRKSSPALQDSRASFSSASSKRESARNHATATQR